MAEPTTSVRAAFRAGWWTNAATPDQDGAGSAAYFDGCEEADWREFIAKAAPRTKAAHQSELETYASGGVPYRADQQRKP